MDVTPFTAESRRCRLSLPTDCPRASSLLGTCGRYYVDPARSLREQQDKYPRRRHKEKRSASGASSPHEHHLNKPLPGHLTTTCWNVVLSGPGLPQPAPRRIPAAAIIQRLPTSSAVSSTGPAGASTVRVWRKIRPDTCAGVLTG